MNSVINSIAITILITYFICAQVYPKPTMAITFVMVLTILGYPFYTGVI